VCAAGSERPQAFFLADDSLLSQEVADGKIRVQLASALRGIYTYKNGIFHFIRIIVYMLEYNKYFYFTYEFTTQPKHEYKNKSPCSTEYRHDNSVNRVLGSGIPENYPVIDQNEYEETKYIKF
jgi:hypothetical protein